MGSATAFSSPSTPYFTDAPATHSFFSWIQKMRQVGITSGCSATAYCPNDPVTRGQMAVFLERGAFNELLPAGIPIVNLVSPSSGSRGTGVSVYLGGVGTNFTQSGTRVTVGGGVTVNAVTVTSPIALNVDLTVDAGAELGQRTIIATTGQEEAVAPNRFTVR